MMQKMEFIVRQGKQISILQIVPKNVINIIYNASSTSSTWMEFLVPLIFIYQGGVRINRK